MKLHAPGFDLGEVEDVVDQSELPGGLGTWSLLQLSAHFVERERKPVGAIAASPCDIPAQLANKSFRADHVRFGSSVGEVVQVLMRSDVPAAEAFFRDHLLFETYGISRPRTSLSSLPHPRVLFPQAASPQRLEHI